MDDSQLCDDFAAPTQRMWIGIGMFATQGNFDVAYRWSSWLCWALNLLVAELIIRRTRNQPLNFGGTPLTYPGRVNAGTAAAAMGAQ